MRKAERLFQLITLLRSRRRAVTAGYIAQELEVSIRTVYRDIAALQASGVPIDGAAGVGYMLHHSFELPPLMFTRDELSALLVGARMIQVWGDEHLATSARQALSKIQSVLPNPTDMPDPPIIVPDLFMDLSHKRFYSDLRESIESKCRVKITYITAEEALSERVLQPLGMVYWGGKWTLIAWCELRDAYRQFRIDRIQSLQTLRDPFEILPDKSLKHYLNQYENHD